MTRNAAIFLPKGGVGKTWLSAHLSAGLALVGRRVLVVDVDATQCQLALAFDGIHRRGDTARLFRETRTPVSSLVQTVGAFPGLDIITAEPESSRALPDFLRNSGPFWITTLAERLATVNDYDYILFDCGPGLDEVTQCVIHACNEIWMPLLLPALFGSDLTGDSVVRQLTRWFVVRIGGGRPAGRPC